MTDSLVETPTAKINFRTEEKIGLPDYSNIVIGLSITRDVEDEGLESVMEQAKEIAREVEAFIAEEREFVLRELQGEANVRS